MARLLAAMLLAICIMNLHGHSYQSNVARADQITHLNDLTIQAVRSLPWGSSIELLARTKNIRGILKLRWYKPDFQPNAGDTVRAAVNTRPPHGLANYGGFSYRRYLLGHNIVATGSISSLKLEAAGEQSSYQQVMLMVLNTIRNSVQTFDNDSIFAALIVGVRDALTSAQRDLFNATGTAHLMAISGLHVGMVFFAIVFVLSQLQKFISLLPATIRMSRNSKLNLWPFYVGWLFAVAYGAVSGFALPTVRALVFISCWLAARHLRWRLSGWSILLFTAALFISITPWVVYSASFWLSFTAVASVLLGLTISKAYSLRGWAQLLIIQLAILVVMLPLQVGLFGQQSLLAPLLNLLAIPWLGLAILPLALMGALASFASEHLANALYWLADCQLTGLLHMLEWGAHIDAQLLHLDLVSSALLLITTVVLATWCLLQRRLVTLPRWRFTFTVSLLVAFCLTGIAIVNRHYVPKLTVDVLDVGQGLSVVIRHKRAAAVYDVGAAYSSGFNMADAALLPYLRHQGISKLATVIVSHDDNDHAGALQPLLASMPVAQLFGPQQLINKHPDRMVTNCHGILNIDFRASANLPMSFITTVAQTHRSDNDSSCLLYVGSYPNGLVLPGDISASVEAELTPSAVAADVLLAPHHGSNTSSSYQLIDTVQPQYAVFSAGYRNRWRFPAKAVRERYGRRGVAMLATADTGMLRFSYLDKQWQVSDYCSLHWPVWYQC